MQRTLVPSDMAANSDLAPKHLVQESDSLHSETPRSGAKKAKSSECEEGRDVEEDATVAGEPTLLDEFFRLNHRRPTRTEERFLELILDPTSENVPPVWFEGGVPESCAALAALLVECAGKRVLLIGPERALIDERETRFATRLPVRRISNSERAVARLPKGPLLVLSSFENVTTLPRRLAGEKFDLVFIEGAEAISSAAPEYRPSVGKIPTLVERFSAKPVYFSRFLEASVKEKALLALGLVASSAGRPFASFVEDLEAPDLRFAPNAGLPELLAVIEEMPRPALVLCETPTLADLAFAALESEQVPCHRFHAAMSSSERASELLQFALPGRRAVLVATSSFAPEASLGTAPRFLEHFGRGYGRADVRSIIHVGLPASLEQLASEYGLLSRAHVDKSQMLVLVEEASSGRREIDEADPILAVLAKKRPNGEALEAVLLVLTSKAKGALFPEEEILGSAGVGRHAARLALSLLVEVGLISASDGPVRSYGLVLDELAGRDAPSSSSRGSLKEQLLERSRILGDSLDQLFAGDVERRRSLLSFAVDETRCRRSALLAYFGFTRRSGDENLAPCGACDVCRPLTSTENETLASALGAFYRSRAPEDRRARSGDESVDANEAIDGAAELEEPSIAETAMLDETEVA